MATANSEKLAKIRAQASTNRANASANKNQTTTPKSTTTTQKPVINASTTSNYTGGGVVNGVSFNNVSNASPTNLSQNYGQVAYLGNQTNQNYQFSGVGAGTHDAELAKSLSNHNSLGMSATYDKSAQMGLSGNAMNDISYMAANGIRPVNMSIEQEKLYNEYRNSAQRDAFNLYHAGGDVSQLSNYQQGIVKGYEEQIQRAQEEREMLNQNREVLGDDAYNQWIAEYARTNPTSGVAQMYRNMNPSTGSTAPTGQQFGDRNSTTNWQAGAQALTMPTAEVMGVSTMNQPTAQYNAQQFQPLLSQAQNMGRQYGFDDKMLGWITQAAENNKPMDTPTPEKQAVYDAYQNYMRQDIMAKAQSGVPLDNPTKWKEDLYNQYRAQVLQSGQGQTTGGVQNGQSPQLQAMQEWLQQSGSGQIQQQQAMLQQARDQELAELQKNLQNAVSQGELSVREAQAQFESAKQGIQQQAYQDSEYTQLMSQQRGIANSMQGLGLIQGDQARNNSLLNQNVTTRDQQINTITNQLNAIKNNTATDMTSANSNYNYALAQATGSINANTANQMAQMSWDDYQRQQQFAQDMNMQDREFNFTREQTATQQANQLAQMSQQQRFQLEQMATAQGYDLNKMSVQQQYQLAQMMQGFKYDESLQNSSQQFQGLQNSLDRNQQLALEARRQQHDYDMLGAEQQAQLDMYDTELQRKLALYTPGSDEYKLLNAEADWAYGQAQKENLANMTAEIGHTQLAGLLAMYPTTLPDQSDAKAVESYNKQVESVNKQIERIINDPSAQQYLRDLEKANGASTSSGKSVTDRVRDFLKASNPIGIVPRTIYNAVKNYTP